LVLMVGCAKPPQDAINAAMSAMDAAKPIASEYAASSLQAAEDAKAALDAELKAQQDKFALFRSYKKTDELVADLKAKSEKAAADGAAGKALPFLNPHLAGLDAARSDQMQGQHERLFAATKVAVVNTAVGSPASLAARIVEFTR